ncbi:MAG: hypothetical protein WA662_17395, partial [Pseudolabrys sp.]
MWRGLLQSPNGDFMFGSMGLTILKTTKVAEGVTEFFPSKRFRAFPQTTRKRLRHRHIFFLTLPNPSDTFQVRFVSRDVSQNRGSSK